jgi:hypothetical protein
VTIDIKKEENQKLTAERSAHRQTQEALALERDEKRKVRERLFWRCERGAGRFAWTVSILFVVLLLCGFTAGLGLRPRTPILGWVFSGGSLFVLATTIFSRLFGFNVKDMHQKVKDHFLTWLLKRQETEMGLVLDEW